MLTSRRTFLVWSRSGLLGLFDWLVQGVSYKFYQTFALTTPPRDPAKSYLPSDAVME